MELARNIGGRVRELRLQRGWSVRALGREARLSGPTVDRIEDGHFSPGIDSLERVALALGVTVVELLGETDPAVEVLLPGWQDLDAGDRQYVRDLVRRLADSRGQRSTLRAAEERAPYLGANADAVADARRESERLSESEDRDQEDGGEQRQRRRGGR